MQLKRYKAIKDTFGGYFKKGEILTESPIKIGEVSTYIGENEQCYPISEWQVGKELKSISNIHVTKSNIADRFRLDCIRRKGYIESEIQDIEAKAVRLLSLKKELIGVKSMLKLYT